jgi:hypothetical protein
LYRLGDRGRGSAQCYDGARKSLRRCSILQEPIFMIIGVTNIAPIVALIAGILILIVPRFLNFIVAIYLIVIGITGLMH